MTKMIDGSFTMISNEFILNIKELSHSSVTLYLVLMKHFYRKGENNYVFPSYTKIREISGMGYASISKGVKELLEKGWITKVEKGFNSVNKYYLRDTRSTSGNEVLSTTETEVLQKLKSSTSETEVEVLQKLKSNNSSLIIEKNNSYANFFQNFSKIDFHRKTIGQCFKIAEENGVKDKLDKHVENYKIDFKTSSDVDKLEQLSWKCQEFIEDNNLYSNEKGE